MKRIAWLGGTAARVLAALLLGWLAHELGHGLAAHVAGGELEGLRLSYSKLRGEAWVVYPLVEHAARAKLAGMYGGPIVTFAIGLAAAVASMLRRFRTSVVPTAIVIGTWGAAIVAMLVGGVLRGGREPRDYFILATLAGIPKSQLALGAVLLGVSGSVLLGIWCGRRIGATRGRGGNPARFFASGVVALALALGVAALAERGLDPERSPSVADLARRAERNSSDPVTLRRIAHRFVRRNETERAAELRRRAFEIDPSSDGARYDWAMSLQTEGERLQTDGRSVEAFERFREARELLERHPVRDVPEFVVQSALLAEKLGMGEEAALQWERYAELKNEEPLFATSRDRHVRFAMQRARGLREASNHR